MEITAVRIRRVNGDRRIRASASITLDGSFVVHDLRVIDGPNGLFVSMPARRTSRGDYRDIAHPITSEAREVIEEAVLQAYRDWADSKNGHHSAIVG